MPVAGGRDAALIALRDALAGTDFAGQTLRRLRAGGELSGREAALALQIAQGAIRHQVTLEHLLAAVGRLQPRRVPRELRAILYAAAYQVVWMDRVPVFAAVDQAVEQARRLVGGRSPGMVNALLRNLARAIVERRTDWRRLDARQVRTSWDQGGLFARAVLPEPSDSPAQLALYLAAATGERAGRYRTLVERHGPQAAEQIAWASQALPVLVVQRNPLRATAEEFQAALAAAGAETTPDAAFLPPAAHLDQIPLFAAGGAYVQDTSAAAAAGLVGAQPGERVLDLCAAPGGKTLTLAMQMADHGEVVACDVSAERLARVTANVVRLGLRCVRTCVVSQTAAENLGTFDRAIADVPCTNTGVIARRPEARLGRLDAKLTGLIPLQRAILVRAASQVRPGGGLVYSTCSLEPEENEQQVAWFLAAHPAWRLDGQVTTLPGWGPRLADWRDGGYAARLLRRGAD